MLPQSVLSAGVQTELYNFNFMWRKLGATFNINLEMRFFYFWRVSVIFFIASDLLSFSLVYNCFIS